MPKVEAILTTRFNLIYEARSKEFKDAADVAIRDLARRGMARSGMTVKKTVELGEAHFTALAASICEEVERSISATIFPTGRFEQAVIGLGERVLDRAAHEIEVTVERSIEIAGAERVPLISLSDAEKHARLKICSTIQILAKQLRDSRAAGAFKIAVSAGAVTGLIWLLGKLFFHK